MRRAWDVLSSSLHYRCSVFKHQLLSVPPPACLARLHHACSVERTFPSLLAPDATTDLVTVSVVVPAYNEEERMAGAMDELIGHLKETAAGDP